MRMVNFKDDKNQKDPFLNAEISKTWDYKRGFINLTGLSGLTQNDFGAQNVGFQQFASIQGAANYDFTRRIVGDISAYYRYAHTPSQVRGGEDVDELDTNQFQLRAGIRYEPTLWMAIRLGYEFNTYESSGGDSSDYTENRGLLTIILEPDQPWRF